MPGNKPNYSRMDVLRTLLLINKNTSRVELVEKINLGEGTVRSILDLMKDKELIISTNKGHSLTRKGLNFIKEINSIIEIKDIEFNEIYPGMNKSVILIKTRERKRISFEHRDIAVRHGANGAIISQFKEKLIIPCPNIDFKKTYPNDYDNIISSIELKRENILVICFANKKENAEKGAFAVSLEISKKLDNIISKIC